MPGNFLFTLYVSPTPGQPGPATGVTKSDLDVLNVTSLSIYGVTCTSGVAIDEIRIGTSYADVVPVATAPLSLLTCIAGGL